MVERQRSSEAKSLEKYERLGGRKKKTETQFKAGNC